MRKIIFEVARAGVAWALVAGVAGSCLAALNWQRVDPAMLKVLTALVLASIAVLAVGLVMDALALRRQAEVDDADLFAFEPESEIL